MADRINYEVNFSAVGAQALWNEFLAGSESAGRALNQALGGKVKKELFIEAKTDDSGIKQLVAGEREVYTELQKIINLQEKVKKTQQGSVTSLRQQVNEAKQARDGMVKYGTGADGVFIKVNKINDAWTAQNQRVRDLQKQLDIAGASNVWQKLAAEYNLKGLAGAGRQITDLVNIFQSVSIIAGQVIGSVNQLFDALQRVQSIELTFAGIGATGDIGAVFSESSRIALGLGVNLNTVRDSFQQLSPVILATGGNIQDVSAVTESLSSRFVTFGLSADKSKRVMNGVVQAFAKGKLMAEELTQQISEADPAFRTDLATAIGVSVTELGEMVKAGEVTNEVLLKAIPRMSKAAGLFGKLGSSALDAAKGFREGEITVEQFKNQIATIEQLSLENLVNPDTGALQPLLASLLELRAVITDVITSFANSEVFETFLNILGALASQVSLVIQAIVKVGSIIASITQPIFGTINAIDSLGGKLEGLGIISSLVAGIITAKLLVAIGSLAVSGAIGAGIAGVKLLTQAIKLLQSGAIINLIKTIGSSIAAFIGLGAATTGAAVAEGRATAATIARTVASKALTGQMIAQAAAEKLLGGGGPGGVGPGGKGKVPVTQGRGAAGAGVYGPAPPPPNVQIAQANAAKEAATQTGRWGKAVRGLGAAWKTVPKNPYAIAALTVITAATLGTVAYTSATNSASAGNKSFAETLKNLKANAETAKQGIDTTAQSSLSFEERLKNLKETAKGLSWENAVPGPELFKNIDYSKLIQSAKGYLNTVQKETKKAQEGVANYNKENDKTGAKGLKIAEDLKVAEGAVNAALDITKQKRAQLIAEAEKGGKTQSKLTVAQLAAYDKQIKKIEQEKVKINELKKTAAGKGINIDVLVDTKKAIDTVESFKTETATLQAKILIEADPSKREKLQSELNGIEAQLKYLQQDTVQVKVEAKFKIDQRALQDGINLSQAVLSNLQAAADYAQAVIGLQAGYLSGQERTAQIGLDDLNERLDGEKEIRQERIQAAEEAGASEEQLQRMKQEDRAADKAARDQVKTKEEEIKRIAESKRQLEIDALNAKLAALPAQQAAERESLLLQQKLVRLEQERLLAASQRAKLEGIDRLNKLKDEADKAAQRGDTAEEERLMVLFNRQVEYINLLKEEERSLQKSLGVLKETDALAQDTLGKKQAAQTLDLQSQLAAQNALTTQGQTKTAVEGTAAAMNNAKQNAQAFTQASQDAEQYEKSGAAEARRQADAKADAAEASKEAAGAAGDNAEATDDAKGATEGAVGAADDLTTSLGSGADEAERIYDTLLSLDGKTIDVNVNYNGSNTPGLWTGGPTVGGQTYRINELGQEGFLSSGGTLSPINKPRNALWRAPSKGMVIPAHIMSSLNVPTGRVSTGVRPASVATGGNGMAKVVRAIQGALSRTNKVDPGLQEMASVQAYQAQQIGKLSRAVNDLADKNWNVNVNVRNRNNSAYLNAMNRMI